MCKLCQNHCKLTITTFNDGQRHVSGNRCERGATQERRAKKSDMPNLYDYKYRRTFAYRRLRQGQDTRGEIGIPRVLGMYENYPLWFTILTQLGFRVIISGRSNHEPLVFTTRHLPLEPKAGYRDPALIAYRVEREAGGSRRLKLLRADVPLLLGEAGDPEPGPMSGGPAPAFSCP